MQSRTFIMICDLTSIFFKRVGIRGKFARCIDSGGVVRERAGESSACVISNTCKQIVTSVCLFWIFFTLWTSFLQVYFMFVQPEFLLELNCADFFSTCNYCMLLAKWIPVTCFYLFYTTDDSPFEDDPFDIPDTPPVIQHLTSQSRKEVWDCLVRHAVVQLRGGLVLRSQHPCARFACAQCHRQKASSELPSAFVSKWVSVQNLYIWKCALPAGSFSF